MEEDELTINTLIEESHRNAVDKGWYNPPKTFPEAIALFHEEASEALKEYRNGHEPGEIYWKIDTKNNTGYAGRVMTDDEFRTLPDSTQIDLFNGGHAKPEGIPIEMADILIRVADTCGFYGIALEDALRIKMAFNITRPIRHGGKRV